MANKAPESSSPANAQQGETPATPAPQPGPPDHQPSRTGNTVSKSGLLFLGSKGIGWTSWKKRWFILTGNSLVFYRSDPNAAPQKSNETVLPLGSIDLDNSGSVELKTDKKILNLLLPDGRDGRAFMLKGETLEDLHEWKNALEAALAQAPSAASDTGQDGILSGEHAETANGSSEQQKDKTPWKSMIIGRPVLLALKDIDGSPSFLEKALKFIEDHGVRTEGVLRQAADVEEVERRLYEYEHGKTEFSSEEDAHIIGDCIKYILRELPSPPVPAPCCNALLEAYRTDRRNRVRAMRAAISETFPEPNRKLLQRTLVMMQAVASHKAVNRMGTSAVAACMSPLLLRPLLAGDCEVENQHLDMGGDNSMQLMQAAAAANHAQAIIIMLLDDYDQIFGDAFQGGSLSDESFSEEEESGSEEESEYDEDDENSEDEENESGSDELDGDEDYESDEEEGEGENNCKISGSEMRKDRGDNENNGLVSQKSTEWHGPDSNSDEVCDGEKDNAVYGDSRESHQRLRRGHASARKKVSKESVELSNEEEEEVQTLEATKQHLERQVAKEVVGNEKLQASLDRQRKALHDRRLALEIDALRLQEQLQYEREIRAAIDAGLSPAQIPVSANIDEKVKRELMDISAEENSVNSLSQRVDDIAVHLNQQRGDNYSIMIERGIQPPETPSQETISMSKQNNEPAVTSHNAEKSAKTKGQSSHSPEGAKSSSNPLTDASSFRPTISKKFSSKAEGSSTGFGLSKLTNRLNFLKERRMQIANELQGSSRGREPSQSPQTTEKGKGSDPAQNPNQLDEPPPQPKSGNKPPTEISSPPNQDEGPARQGSGEGKSPSEAQPAQHQDEPKSSGQKRSCKPAK